MADYDDEDGSDYTEESYYEEVEDDGEEQVAAPPAPTRPKHPLFGGGAPAPSSNPGRPVHPLFGGAGAKNALAAAAANMEKKRSINPVTDPRPTRTVNATDAPVASGPPSRPSHPLFGGGGGGKSALNDQILAAAAKRNNRVGDAPPAPTPAKPAPKPAPMGGGSLADQVAMMAARRNNRVQGNNSEPAESESAAPQQYQRRVQPVAAPPKPTPAPKPSVPPPAPVAAPAPAPVAPPAPAPVTAPTKKIVRKASSKKQMAAPANEPTPASKPVFQKAQLKKTETPPTTATATESKSLPPVFSQGRLKQTGNKEMLVPEEPAAEESVEVVEQAPTQWSTPGTPAPASQKITRVTQSDPTYEIVEYKCYCTIM